MASTSALPQGLRTYLATCSAEHADQIIQALHEHLRQGAGGHTPNAASSMAAQTGSKVAKPSKKLRSKKAKQEGTTGGPKRPLNSWMAFRKYYNGSLAPHTQKAISKVLMTWWREDPFEAKWSILAKAYSIVRGSREKADAPLDEFFRLCAPRIGVIPPDQYQQMMGWQLIPAKEGDQDKMPQVVRLFIPNLDTFEEKYTTTNLSADDLVEYCTRFGYIQTNASTLPQPAAHGTLTMAVQPTTINTQLTVPNVEQGNTEIPLSPWSFALATNLHAAITEQTPQPAAGSQALNDATEVVGTAGAYPYNNLFDPTSQFEVDFNPNESNGLADGGAYDAFDPSANVAVDEMLNIDWNQFVNDDGMA